MAQITIELPANGQRTIRAAGSVFFVIDCTGAFKVEADRQGKLNMAKGRRFGSPSGRKYSKLTFIDTSGTANTIIAYHGSEEFEGEAASVNNDVTVNANLRNDVDQCIACPPLQYLRQANTGVVTEFRVTETWMRKAIVSARNSLDGTVNVGPIKIGASGSNSEQPITINPGNSYDISPPVGGKVNLQNWYFVTENDDDGVVISGY